jgi:hypothetical protein
LQLDKPDSASGFRRHRPAERQRRRKVPPYIRKPEREPPRSITRTQLLALVQSGNCDRRVDLLDSDPPIWREIEVPAAMTLKQLHAVVQAAMGWEEAHLWEFAVGRERIASSRAAKLTLQALLRPRTTKLTYITTSAIAGNTSSP